MLVNILATIGAINIGSLIWIVFMLGFHSRAECHLESQSKAARRQARKSRPAAESVNRLADNYRVIPGMNRERHDN